MSRRASNTASSSTDTFVPRKVACEACRKRKSFCSEDKPKCDFCRKNSVECVYPEARIVSVSENYLRELEAQAALLKEYEESLTEARISVNAISAPQSIPRARLSTTIEEKELEDHPLRNPISGVTTDATGKQRASWIGPASSDNVLHAVLDVTLGRKPVDNLDVSSESSSYYPLLLPRRQRSLIEEIKLPPIHFVPTLFDAQYTYIGTIFSFVDRAVFEDQLQKAYQGPPNLSSADDCLAYSKVLVVLAFGRLYSVNQWNDSDNPPGLRYFTQALQLLPDLHEEPSILFVETLSLIGYFMQNLNRRDAAFLYVGTALRMAISLALHQEVSSTQISEIEKEHRRRVWWSVYSLDRILSVKSGNPIMIHDEDIGVKLPSRLPHEPSYCPPVVLRHYTELSRILSRIMIYIYRKTPKSGSSLMTSVESIMSSLKQWHLDLPQELRFESEKLNTSRESVSTLVHYYQCINMTVRPLLFHIVQKRLKASAGEREKDWKEGLSVSTIEVIETCISAAHNTIAMMTVAEKKNLLATYGYMDGEHIFSAAIVLIMVCVALPQDHNHSSAMDAALELLKQMVIRGNTHIEAKYMKLVQLRSMTNGTRPMDPTNLTRSGNTHFDLEPEVAIIQPQQEALLQVASLPEVMPNFPILPFAVNHDDIFWEESYTNAQFNIDGSLDDYTNMMQMAWE